MRKHLLTAVAVATLAGCAAVPQQADNPLSGCWSNVVDGVDDTFCFESEWPNVTVSLFDSSSGLQCSGPGRALIRDGRLVIVQPISIGGCNVGADFTAQVFDCDLGSLSDNDMACVNRFTGADGVEYQQPMIFTHSATKRVEDHGWTA